MIRSEEKPVKMLVTRGRKRIYVTANIGVQEVDGGYEYDAIHLQMNEPPTYETLVAALVREKYSSDKMEAIINNYLLDATDEAKNEFVEMQEWRKKVKEFAREVFE